MGQDIRKMMRDYTPETPRLSDGHEMRFEEKLRQLDEKPSSGFGWRKIAAVFIVMLAAGALAYYLLDFDGSASTELVDNTNTELLDQNEPQITMGDLSPDLKKVEDYYMAGINVQLASLKVNDENKELVDSYMIKLNELDAEYQILNKELNEVGPSESTITALIDNLQLRLELLFKLKNKLEELKNQNDDNVRII